MWLAYILPSLSKKRPYAQRKSQDTPSPCQNTQHSSLALPNPCLSKWLRVLQMQLCHLRPGLPRRPSCRKRGKKLKILIRYKQRANWCDVDIDESAVNLICIFYFLFIFSLGNVLSSFMFWLSSIYPTYFCLENSWVWVILW